MNKEKRIELFLEKGIKFIFCAFLSVQSSFGLYPAINRA